MQEITGISYSRAGLFTPGTFTLQPALYIQSLGTKLISNRLRIYENSLVVELKKKDQIWEAQTPQGVVRAPEVILAVNGHIENFGYFKRKLIHIFTYESMTRVLSKKECNRLGGLSDWNITSADPLGTTVRRITSLGGDRIILRNSFTHEPSMIPRMAVQKRFTRPTLAALTPAFRF